MSTQGFNDRRRRAAIAVLAAASLGGAGAALAQQAPLLAGQTGLQIPDAGTRITELDGSFDTAYDSNVARSGKEIAEARGLTPEDETFEPEVNGTIARPIGRETFFLTGHAGYLDYARNTVLNSADIRVVGGAEGRLAICDTNLSGVYSLAQTDLEYIGLPVTGPLSANVKNNFQDVGINFATACGRPTGFALTSTVTQNWYDNSSVYRKELNADATTVSAGVAYRNPVLGMVNVFGQYTRTLYPDQDILTSQELVSLRYQITGAGVSYTRTVGSRLSGTASVSYVSTDPNLGLAGYSGVNYGFDLSYAVTPRLTATTRFDRTTLPTNELGYSYILSDIYSVAFDYRMTTRINWSLGVGRTTDNYDGRNLTLDAPLYSYDRSDTVYGGVAYTLSRHLRVGLSGSYSQRDVNEAGLSYSEGRVALSISGTL